MAFGSEQWMYSAGGFYPDEIGQSLRFNSPDSAYLSRTPSVAGNRTTWTWSSWIKRCRLAANQNIFGIINAATQERFQFNTTDKLSFVFDAGNKSISTDALFRDESSWYHIALVADTTNTTAQDRIRVYVNGVRQSTSGAAITSGQQFDINNTLEHRMCMLNSGTADYHFADQYLAEVNFVDGQALDPTDFGEFKSGVWIPKSYSGTYGTNGFRLDFGNSGSLGADVSGNGNNWTPTNLATTDQMLDTPTNNFAAFNPLAAPNSLANRTFSEGNLRMQNDASGYACAYSTIPVPKTGKWVFEVLFQRTPTGASPWTYNSVGLTTREDLATYINNGTSGYAIDDHGGSGSQVFVQAGAEQGSHAGLPAGTLVQVFVDRDNNQLTFSINGTLQTQTGATVTIPADVDLYAINGTYNNITYGNFGQDSSFAGQKTAQGNTDANGIGDFYYAPPADYLALCSANLPAPAMDPAKDDIPADYFNPVLYTGDSSSPRSITGAGFQPDLVWMKARSAALVHGLYDSVRGPAKLLISNDAGAEIATDPYGYVSSYDTDGFTLTAGTINNATFNNPGQTYVAWNWKAGGTAVANTDGTTASQVSANQKAGFSVVTWAGDNGTTTIGHGLAQAPEIIIRKSRTTAAYWVVTGLALGSQQYMHLNRTDAANFYAPITDPTATVFNGWGTDSNAPSMVAYCFHSVEGFSKFGSYTGNGSTDGAFVYTGFRPAYVMWKNASDVQSWHIYDDERSEYNLANKVLYANLSNAEGTSSSNVVDLLSNGFKLRGNDVGSNASGDTYIFMAFAEMPFKYANAR